MALKFPAGGLEPSGQLLSNLPRDQYQNLCRAGNVRVKTINVRKPTTAIATEWPFSVSRNPIYAGILLLNIGIACFVNTVGILLLTPVLALVLQKAVIEPEEAYLEQKFGDKYLRYKANVRRWI